ncbi:MAG: hypothetical protein JWO58_337 [Chitinophagaceae bacterium]|nr:hypothetical protein [Chitinophagaceae bacterium]
MGTKYVDLEFLMSSAKNDLEQVKEFIQDVLELNAVSIGSLNAAFEKGNFLEMKETAHMLKSSADIFDSTIYKEKLVALEGVSKAGEREAIAKALKEINEIATAWEAQLKEELGKLK